MTVQPNTGDGVPATLDEAVRGLRQTAASVGTRDLVDLIVRHGAEEGELLATYEQLAAEAPDASVRYLIGLILDDEHRHHRLLAELANAIAWSSTGGPQSRAVPTVPTNIDGALLEQTKLLLKSEQSDARALRRLRRRLRPFGDTTLWVLVVELMLLDTRKHATILRFLERRQKS